jgi:hypothetical protein
MMKKIKYDASGPGQAPIIKIGGERYEKGKTYKVNENTAEILLRKGGFKEIINEKTAAATSRATAEAKE